MCDQKYVSRVPKHSLPKYVTSCYLTQTMDSRPVLLKFSCQIRYLVVCYDTNGNKHNTHTHYTTVNVKGNAKQLMFNSYWRIPQTWTTHAHTHTPPGQVIFIFVIMSSKIYLPSKPWMSLDKASTRLGPNRIRKCWEEVPGNEILDLKAGVILTLTCT